MSICLFMKLFGDKSFSMISMFDIDPITLVKNHSQKTCFALKEMHLIIGIFFIETANFP